jgi:hypothetical protein
VLSAGSNSSIALRAVFCVTKGAVKQVVHEFKSEALPRCLKSSPRPFQIISMLVVLIWVSKSIAAPMIQTCLHKSVPPFFVKVVAFNTDDKIVQNDADTRPHDDNHVASGIDELDSYLFQGLKCPLQQAYRVLDSYTDLYTVT